MIGLLVAGPLVERYGPRELVGVFGALGLIVAIGCLLVVRRETRSAEEEHVRLRDSVET